MKILGSDPEPVCRVIFFIRRFFFFFFFFLHFTVQLLYLSASIPDLPDSYGRSIMS
jgi:hypothetical protein